MAATENFRPESEAAARRHVVFNADDFGLSSGINEAVQLAHSNGLLRSASLMATGQAFDEAVGLALGLEGFEVGIHLCATQTRSRLRPARISELAGSDGRFRHTVGSLGARLFFSPQLLDEIVDEWRAQIEWVLETGIRPDHLNSHQHLHMHPMLFGKALELAEHYQIPVVRMPHTNFRLNARLDNSRLIQKFLKAAVFVALRGTCLAVHRADEYGVLIADHTYGLLQIGRTDEAYLQKLLPRLPQGFSEIYTHPGVRPEPCSPELRREVELAALLSSRVRRLVEEENIEVTTFRCWAAAVEAGSLPTPALSSTTAASNG